MLLGGDEFGRTQHGNNNAYCQDNETSWIDWSLVETPEGKSLAGFVGRVVALRHRNPVLRSPYFLHGREFPAEGVPDISGSMLRARSSRPSPGTMPRIAVSP